MVLYSILQIATFIVVAVVAAFVLAVVGTIIVRFIRRHWKTMATVALCALLLAAALTLHGVARAETQERTAFVKDIKVFENIIVLVDEDGEPWPFPFSVFGEKMDEYVGKEHTVYYDPEASFGRVFWLDVEVEEVD